MIPDLPMFYNLIVICREIDFKNRFRLYVARVWDQGVTSCLGQRFAYWGRGGAMLINMFSSQEGWSKVGLAARALVTAFFP